MKCSWISGFVLIQCCLCLFSIQGLHAQIDSSRIFDWSSAGNQIPFPTPDTLINALELGADNQGIIPCDSLINELLERADSLAISLYFPAGSYRFHNTLQLKSNTEIYGDGPAETHFLFDLNGTGHCIQAIGIRIPSLSTLSEDASIRDSLIIIDSTSHFEPGYHIQLRPNDGHLVSSSWAEKSTGFIAKIMAIDSNSILLDRPLMRDFKIDTSSAQPNFIDRLAPVENIFIHDLSIERMDQTTGQTSNIFFNIAYQCQVSCIESYQSNFAHLSIQNSHHIEVSHSYFNDAFDFGGGGKAYGVVLQFTSGDCLIHNNHFERLRHAMLLQAGPNGNVLSYNYSIDPYWTGTTLPDDAAGDLVLHGNYPYANLFEGNVIQNIVIDDSHGQNGPLNTLFRNRAEDYGIVMNFGIPSDKQNFIGNEISNDGFFKGNYLLFGEDHYELANNHKGDIVPSQNDTITEQSLYLSGTNDYYKELANWPPIGIPNSLNQHPIEAQYKLAEALDFCEPIIISTTLEEISRLTPRIFPNPSNGILQWENSGVEIQSIAIYSSQGSLLHQEIISTKTKIDLNYFSAGTYVVELKDKSGIRHSLLWIKG